LEQVNIPKFPVKLQLDAAHEKMQDIESRFLKNVRVLQNANPNNTNLSGNNTKTGSNAGSQTPLLSNKLVDNEFVLPLGTNKTIGTYESKETNELYWFVWNSVFLMISLFHYLLLEADFQTLVKMT